MPHSLVIRLECTTRNLTRQARGAHRRLPEAAGPPCFILAPTSPNMGDMKPECWVPSLGSSAMSTGISGTLDSGSSSVTTARCALTERHAMKFGHDAQRRYRRQSCSASEVLASLVGPPNPTAGKCEPNCVRWGRATSIAPLPGSPDAGHAARPSSDQPLSSNTGRGPKLPVGPPTPFSGFQPNNRCLK